MRRIHRSPVNSLTKANDAERWCFLWSAPTEINDWLNNGEAGDLRRHRADYDVTVMGGILKTINSVPIGALVTSIPDVQVKINKCSPKWQWSFMTNRIFKTRFLKRKYFIHHSKPFEFDSSNFIWHRVSFDFKNDLASHKNDESFRQYWRGGVEITPRSANAESPQSDVKKNWHCLHIYITLNARYNSPIKKYSWTAFI